MKKLLIIVLSLLLVWNAFLTYQLNQMERPVENKPEVTVVQNRINGFSTDLTEIIKKVESSVVAVRVMRGNLPLSMTSGFVWLSNDEGVWILTNGLPSGVQTETEIVIHVVFDNGAIYQAEVAGLDSVSDVALLKVNPEFTVSALSIGDSSLAENGEWLIAVGSAKNEMFVSTVSVGVVSRSAAEYSVDLNKDGNEDWSMEALYTDAKLNRGNSGGPLVNQAGELMAMSSTSLGINGEAGIYRCITSNELNLIASTLLEKGSIARKILGLKTLDIKTLTSYQKSALDIDLSVTEGVFVASVDENSLADAAGIKAGDLLVSMNETPVSAMADYRQMLYSLTDAEQLELVCLRENEEVNITVVFE